MKRPSNIQKFKPVDPKLGIKSSLPKSKSTIALVILLWLSNDKKYEIEYSETDGDKITISENCYDKLIQYLRNNIDIKGDSEEDIMNYVNENQLFHSQLESLIVALELVWRIASIKFKDSNKADSAERTGKKRFEKILSYTNNIDLFDTLIESNKKYCQVLYEWLQGKKNVEDTHLEKQLVRVINYLSDDVVLKMLDNNQNVYFNMTSVYEAMTQKTDEIDINGDGEAKGALRIVKGALGEGLNYYLAYNKNIVTMSDNVDYASYILYRLQSEIQTQYITRKQNLLKTIYTYIANEKTDKNDVSYSLYGTNSFNLVWEKVCADNFGSVLDKKIVDLPLSNPEWNKVEYKDKTLRKVIKSPRWRKIEFPDVEDPKVETLKPDLVCIYPVDEQKKDYCFGIYDAKYYCIDYQIHGDKVIISGQPGVGDVTKQYLYQLAFDDFIMKQGYRYVQNMFFCPDEVGDKQYGWVQMEILNHIGNKRLENIAVVKLCASKMYQLYLDNQTISEHEINQYIPDIGRREISEQNFANRMLAYLMRITNASKMAEEKLEMKADKGKLIYPRQIKRELGAKIIYDAICPVASKAFYGFNPYEKENYGTMVAEDIGNSYGRCNQIADASIEIEKKIKELSEKELQDEKVIIDILRKCFEGKEDIASMAEGDNLEMLVEKVMELVRNLYL